MKGKYLYKKMQPHPAMLGLYIVMFLMFVGVVIFASWQGYEQGYESGCIAAIVVFSIFAMLVVIGALESISILEVDSDAITVRCYRGTIAKIRPCDVRKVIYKYCAKGFYGVIIEESDAENRKYKRTLLHKEKTRMLIFTTNPNKDKDKLVKLLKDIMPPDVVWTKETYYGYE